MRRISNLVDVQIVLKEILDWKDTQLSKAKDQRGHQIKNAGDATDPSDLVTLQQLRDAFPPKSKIAGTTVLQTFNNTGGGGGGGVGPAGPPGPQGPQGIPGTSAVANIGAEIPTGILNASNKNFTLSNLPLSGTLILQLNGVTQRVDRDFTLSGFTITYLFAPKANDWHFANYFY